MNNNCLNLANNLYGDCQQNIWERTGCNTQLPKHLKKADKDTILKYRKSLENINNKDKWEKCLGPISQTGYGSKILFNKLGNKLEKKCTESLDNKGILINCPECKRIGKRDEGTWLYYHGKRTRIPSCQCRNAYVLTNRSPVSEGNYDICGNEYLKNKSIDTQIDECRLLNDWNDYNTNWYYDGKDIIGNDTQIFYTKKNTKNIYKVPKGKCILNCKNNKINICNLGNSKLKSCKNNQSECLQNTSYSVKDNIKPKSISPTCWYSIPVANGTGNSYSYFSNNKPINNYYFDCNYNSIIYKKNSFNSLIYIPQTFNSKSKFKFTPGYLYIFKNDDYYRLSQIASGFIVNAKGRISSLLPDIKSNITGCYIDNLLKQLIIITGKHFYQYNIQTGILLNINTINKLYKGLPNEIDTVVTKEQNIYFFRDDLIYIINRQPCKYLIRTDFQENPNIPRCKIKIIGNCSKNSSMSNHNWFDDSSKGGDLTTDENSCNARKKYWLNHCNSNNDHYVLGEKKSIKCKGNNKKVSKTNCLKAANSIIKKYGSNRTTQLLVGDGRKNSYFGGWGGVPPGCNAQDSGSNINFFLGPHYNIGTGGNNGFYTPLCINNTDTYQKRNGDCPGFNLKSDSGTVQKCQQTCDNDPNCKGFSRFNNSCIYKTKKCAIPIKNGWTFYEKLNDSNVLNNYITPINGIIIYPEKDYIGNGVKLTPGIYSLNRLKQLGLNSDKVMSIVVNNGFTSSIKTGINSKIISDDISDLSLIGLNSKIESVTIKKITVSKGEWVLLFRQTAGTYKTNDEWKRLNIHTPYNKNYSILDHLSDKFRGKDGKFQFIIKWPELKNGLNEWKQSSNPIDMNSGGVSGYTPINICYNNNFWKGLERNTNPISLLDGSVNHSYWFYAIGSSAPFQNGIPGPFNSQKKVELYIKLPEGKPRPPTPIETTPITTKSITKMFDKIPNYLNTALDFNNRLYFFKNDIVYKLDKNNYNSKIILIKNFLKNFPLNKNIIKRANNITQKKQEKYTKFKIDKDSELRQDFNILLRGSQDYESNRVVNINRKQLVTMGKKNIDDNNVSIYNIDRQISIQNNSLLKRNTINNYLKYLVFIGVILILLLGISKYPNRIIEKNKTIIYNLSLVIIVLFTIFISYNISIDLTRSKIRWNLKEWLYKLVVDDQVSIPNSNDKENNEKCNQEGQ